MSLSPLQNIRNKRLKNQSLHGNSIFLIAAQGLVMVFGYTFWIITARLYSSQAVGIAGALISMATLIAQVSILGLNNAIVRFLPTSTRKNDKINTCLWLITGTSLIVSIVYLLLLPLLSHKLLFIQHDWSLLLLFIGAMVLTTLNTFTDAVFLVNHATKYNVVIYGAYSILRMALPFALVSWGVTGIFGAHVLGLLLAVALSLYYMMRKLHYRPAFTFSKDILKLIGGYSAGSYIAGFLWALPMLIAPVMVVDQVGTVQAAYFYMVLTIVNCLLIIPTAGTQSLFAEGSHDEKNARLYALVRKSLRFTLSLVAIGALGLMLLGKYIIAVFGREYTTGSGLLDLLAITTIFVAVNMTGNSILKIKQRIITLIVVNAIGAVVTLSGFVVWLPTHGIMGIGLGYLAGQLAMLVCFAGLYASDRFTNTSRYPAIVKRTS